MITLATLVRDTPHIETLLDVVKKRMPCEYEIVIGDNSVDPDYSAMIKELADEYIYIADKQLFRMGLPWAHNLINSVANTYKIFYIDSDEYPLWIHPNIEDYFDTNYVIPAIRYDFFELDEIFHLDKQDKDFPSLLAYCNSKKEAGLLEGVSVQDRLYNSRYVQFEGLCHSVFHCPPNMGFRGHDLGTILLHNKTVRLSKDKDRMDKLIDEQFARQNINFMLASSEQVLGWGRGVKHKFEDWKEFVEAYASQK